MTSARGPTLALASAILLGLACQQANPAYKSRRGDAGVEGGQGAQVPGSADASVADSAAVAGDARAALDLPRDVATPLPDVPTASPDGPAPVPGADSAIVSSDVPPAPRDAAVMAPDLPGPSPDVPAPFPDAQAPTPDMPSLVDTSLPPDLAPPAFDLPPDVADDVAPDVADDLPPDVAPDGPAIVCVPWWMTGYRNRRALDIPAGASALAAGVWVAHVFDHAALVTQGAARVDGSDVRVARFDGAGWTESQRFLDESSRWNAPDTKIWFRLLAPVAALGRDANHYLHTGNPGALDPMVRPFAVPRSIQTGTASISINGTVTIPIAAVVPERSLVFLQTRHNSIRPVGSMVRLRIASATTLQLTRVTDEAPPGRIDVRYHVVEYGNGVKVQRGVAQQAAKLVDVQIAQLSSISQAFVTWSKTPGITDYIWDFNDPMVADLRDARVLQMRVEDIKLTHDVGWEVTEFTNPADVRVQRGAIPLRNGALTTDVALGASVDLSRSFVLADFRSPGVGSDTGARMLAASFTGPTTLHFERLIGGNADDLTEIGWQAVELRDGSEVRSGVSELATGVTLLRIPLASAVDPARSVALASVQQGGGQNTGATPYAADDVLGVCSVTLAVSPTELVAERAASPNRCRIAWSVLQLPRTAAATAGAVEPTLGSTCGP